MAVFSLSCWFPCVLVIFFSPTSPCTSLCYTVGSRLTKPLGQRPAFSAGAPSSTGAISWPPATWFSLLPFTGCSLHVRWVYHLERWLSSFGMKGTTEEKNPHNVPEGWPLILEDTFHFFLQIPDFFLLLFLWESDSLETDDPFSYYSTREGRGRINCPLILQEFFQLVSKDWHSLCVLRLWLTTL